MYGRSQWPSGRIPPEAWKSVSCECFMLSSTGLCDRPITHPEESYRLWCVTVCDLETWRKRRPWPALGCSLRGGGEEETLTYPLELHVNPAQNRCSEGLWQYLFNPLILQWILSTVWSTHNLSNTPLKFWHKWHHPVAERVLRAIITGTYCSLLDCECSSSHDLLSQLEEA
jgi:hypothetical protein